MLRKQILKTLPSHSVPQAGEIDIAATAIVQVTSEDAAHPIDHVFDHRRGLGGSRWVAEDPGEQTLLLVFDTPQTIRRVILEIEEPDMSRTQEICLSVSHDGGQTYRELRRQEYHFSPPGTTFEREDWAVLAEGVTHLQLWMKPDKGGQPYRATLTSLVCKGADISVAKSDGAASRGE
jgi:hypothetical protein